MSKNPQSQTSDIRPQISEKSLKYKTFALLYRETALPLMKFLIKKMGGDTRAAEEVFSQTIEAALKGYYRFEYKSTFFTWVCRIGLNKVADYYRDQINERSRLIYPLFKDLANIEDKTISHEERLIIEELRINLRECLNLLPEEKRLLLQWRYWEEMTVGQIAHNLGISERAAEGKLYRARNELRYLYLQKR